MIVVSKRVDSTGKTHWKNERKRLSAGEIAYVRGLTVDSGER
jgi:hypothetical protein